MERRVVLLCAGGTGGHLFPAEALAHELVARGWEVHLATDDRADRYAGKFPARAIHIIKSATPSGKNPIAISRALWTLWGGYQQSRELIKQLSPLSVVGFGGYPTLPPVIAAQRMKVPTLLHDANAIMGRANRLLAKKADLVAMGFAGASNTGSGEKPPIITGNPVRPAVLEAAGQPYKTRKKNDPFNLLIFGGSQGAQFFSQIMPKAIDLLEPAAQAKLRIVHQARPEDEHAVSDYYKRNGVKAEVAPFFSNMPEKIANSDLVICRAGASSVSELSVIGRPSILVPFPFALDHDQAMNAQTVASSGGAWICEQSELSPEKLAERLKNAMDDPKGLALAAEKAKKTGKGNAAEALADCVEQVAGLTSTDITGK
ncbi:MAG: undecaprenyldiphospho-muramoylpentapeptide beta-N-acetylglucosaminyltransferase [Rhizobiaceae bacterium]